MMHLRRIALTSDGIFLPRIYWGWFSAEEFIEYKGITNSEVTDVKRIGSRDSVVTQVHLYCSGGKFSIKRADLPEGAFDEVCRVLRERVAAAQHGH